MRFHQYHQYIADDWCLLGTQTMACINKYDNWHGIHDLSTGYMAVEWKEESLFIPTGKS